MAVRITPRGMRGAAAYGDATVRIGNTVGGGWGEGEVLCPLGTRCLLERVGLTDAVGGAAGALRDDFLAVAEGGPGQR